MSKFRIGDRVKRHTRNHMEVRVGNIYTVINIIGSHDALVLKEIDHSYYYDPSYFDLYEVDWRREVEND